MCKHAVARSSWAVPYRLARSVKGLARSMKAVLQGSEMRAHGLHVHAIHGFVCGFVCGGLSWASAPGEGTELARGVFRAAR